MLRLNSIVACCGTSQSFSPGSKMIKGLCSTLKLLLLLTPVQAMICSERVNSKQIIMSVSLCNLALIFLWLGNIDYAHRQVMFESVICSSSGNNRSLYITIGYHQGNVPSQMQIEYQCFQSEPLSLVSVWISACTAWYMEGSCYTIKSYGFTLH